MTGLEKAARVAPTVDAEIRETAAGSIAKLQSSRVCLWACRPCGAWTVPTVASAGPAAVMVAGNAWKLTRCSSAATRRPRLGLWRGRSGAI